MSDVPTPGYIYVIVEREFVRSGEPVVKVGRTSNVVRRIAEYPKGSKLLFCMYCDSLLETEAEVLRLLDKAFLRRSDIGRESFEGNFNSILSLVSNFVTAKLLTGRLACPAALLGRNGELEGAVKTAALPSDVESALPSDEESAVPSETGAAEAIVLSDAEAAMPSNLEAVLSDAEASGPEVPKDTQVEKLYSCEACDKVFTTRQARHTHKHHYCKQGSTVSKAKQLGSELDKLSVKVAELIQRRHGNEGACEHPC